MGKFDGLVAKLVIASILFLGIFSFIISVQSSNNAVQPAAEDEVFNESFSKLVEDIEESTKESEEKYDVFNSEEPAAGFGSIVLFGIVSVGKSFSNMIFTLFGALIKFPLTILGIAPNVYNLILTWIIITVIVAAWLLYKLGG